MADAYGYFLFNQSEDCVLDEKELVKRLNKYRWNFSNYLWKIEIYARMQCRKTRLNYATSSSRCWKMDDGSNIKTS